MDHLGDLLRRPGGHRVRSWLARLRELGVQPLVWEEIAVLRAAGQGIRQIAAVLRRSLSTISNELCRNAATRGGRLDYRASVAQWHSELRARRRKPDKLAVHDRLRD